MVWPGLGVNYKSQAKVAADIAYFNSIGLHYIRPHIPGYANNPLTNSGINAWRAVGKTFKDAGFYNLWGLSGTTTSTNYQQYHDAIMIEAAYCWDNQICDEFEIGNELELHGNNLTSLTQSGGLATAVTTTPHGYTTGQTVHVSRTTPSGYSGSYAITVVNSTTFTFSVSSSLASPATGLGIVSDLTIAQINANLRTIAADVKTVFPGPISYAISGSSTATADWITNGKGALDYLSSNLYSDYDIVRHRFNKSHEGVATSMKTAFGDAWYLSEFNVEAGDADWPIVPDDDMERELANMYQFFLGIGVTKAYLYQYRTYLDSNTSNFNLRKSDDTFRPAWNVLLTPNGSSGRRMYV